MNIKALSTSALIFLLILIFSVAAFARSDEQVESVTFYAFTQKYAPVRHEAAKMVAESWRELGLEVKFRPQEFSSLVSRYLDHDLQALSMFWSARPERLNPQLFLENWTTGASNNASDFSDHRYDELVEKAGSSTDREQRRDYIYQAQEILAEQVPSIFIFHRNTLSAYNKSIVEDLKPLPGDNPFWNVWTLMEAEPKKDEPYVRATTRSPKTLNPLGVSYTIEMESLAMNWDRLVRIGFDGSPRPWAAREWSWISSTELEVSLRDDLRWHDGDKVTAEDVQFTYDFLKKWKQPYLSSYYENVESVRIEDQTTVVFVLEDPSPSFVVQSLSQIPILPRHIWEGVVENKGLSHPKEWSEEKSLVGSGPFEVAYFEPDERIVFEKSENHFAADRIPFDTLVLRIFGNLDTAIGAVETGRATFVDELQPLQFDRADSNNSLEAVSAPSFSFTAIFLGTDEPPFDDLSLRKACRYAIDKSQIVNTTLHGKGDVAWSPIAPTNEYWHNSELPTYPHDPERARQILKDAGYRWDSDGRLLRPAEETN
ncbi:MAG: ABC transporter substrate-binding protein [Candidatus Bipolaricaulota bacterium]